MGPLIAVGGIHVADEAVRELESVLNHLCSDYGFPPNELFKWSPDKTLWMHKNLIDKKREEFFKSTIKLALSHNATALVIIEDLNAGMATRAKSRDIDLIQLLLERIHRDLAKRKCHGVVIVSQPSGDRSTESKFLAGCVETLKSGIKATS